jgi:hypothetical protein
MAQSMTQDMFVFLDPQELMLRTFDTMVYESGTHIPFHIAAIDPDNIRASNELLESEQTTNIHSSSLSSSSTIDRIKGRLHNLN